VGNSEEMSAPAQNPEIEEQAKGLARLYLLAAMANVGPLGARIKARRLEQRKAELVEYAQKLRDRGLPTDVVPKMLEASKRHLSEPTGFRVGELMDELGRYVDEREAAGEDRITVNKELMAGGRQWLLDRDMM